MKLVIDAMGGDNAPQAMVEGALAAHKDFSADCELVLVGQEEQIRSALAAAGVTELPQGLSVVNATEVITMEDDPANAFRKKKDSSMTVGLELLKSGEGDGFICAGSTGALLSAATLLVRRSKGIRRAAVAPVIPAGNGGAVLIDAGTNAECTAEYLVQFALMGAAYARCVMGRENPTVGLLNIGAEPGKGDPLHKETYDKLEELKEQGVLNFTGNVESREAVFGQVDVIVADGFSGNIFLKAVEGTAMYMNGLLKDVFKKNTATKLGYLLTKGGLKEFKQKLDYREVGGSCILGIQKPVVKAHGSSDAWAIYCAIRQARSAVAGNVCQDIADTVAQMQGN
jgi:glycerol-3-phosphate acyltransferase PlsX